MKVQLKVHSIMISVLSVLIPSLISISFSIKLSSGRSDRSGRSDDLTSVGTGRNRFGSQGFGGIAISDKQRMSINCEIGALANGNTISWLQMEHCEGFTKVFKHFLTSFSMIHTL